MSDQAQEKTTEQVKPDVAVTTEAPQQKTYAESEMNAIITSRLAAQEKAIRKQLADEQSEKDRQAQLSAEERLKELEAQLKQKDSAFEAERRTWQNKLSLSGKVADPEAAIKLLTDAHLSDDGTVNLDAFLETYPFMKLPDIPTGKSPLSPTNPSRTVGGKPQTLADAMWNKFNKK